MHSCMCVRTHMPAEARGPSEFPLPLRQGLCLTQSSLSTSTYKPNIYLSVYPELGLQVCTTTLGFFDLSSGAQSFLLQGFTDWATPQPFVYLLAPRFFPVHLLSQQEVIDCPTLQTCPAPTARKILNPSDPEVQG